MKSDANLDTRVAWGKRVLLDLVRHLLGSDSAASSTMDRIYTVCLDALTRALLADIENDHSRTDGIGQILEERIRSRLIEEPGPLAPEQVGEIYESLRGLRLEIKSGNEPVLIPHVGGRRNQGLFLHSSAHSRTNRGRSARRPGNLGARGLPRSQNP